MKPPLVGWIVFTSVVMILDGTLAFFEGLVAFIRKHYFVVTADQLPVFDMTTWGWITLEFGVVIALAGLALLSGAEWARWFAIVLASLALLDQLAWLGSSGYPLWTLTIVVLLGTVFHALTVRWGSSGEHAAPRPQAHERP
jgi:hypothetical protein